MIKIKSRNLIETPKKTLIKKNVIDRINVKANVSKGKDDTETVEKGLYNIDIATYKQGHNVDNPNGFITFPFEPSTNSQYRVNNSSVKFIDFDIRTEIRDRYSIRQVCVQTITINRELGIVNSIDTGQNIQIGIKLNRVTDVLGATLGIDSSLEYPFSKELTEEKYINDNMYNATDKNIKGIASKCKYIEYETVDNRLVVYVALDNINYYNVDSRDSYETNFIDKGNYDFYVVTKYDKQDIEIKHIFPSIYCPPIWLYIEKDSDYLRPGQAIADGDDIIYESQNIYNPFHDNENTNPRFYIVNIVKSSNMEIEFKSYESYELTQTYGNGTNSFDLTTNELFQIRSTSETPQYQPVIDRILAKYKNGKETIDFKCAFTNYYDNEGNLKYDKSKGQYISNGEVIKVYISKRNQEVLFSNKNYLVTSSRLTYSNGFAQVEIEAEETDRTE